ncbi:M14 family metallopeptidase [Algoriphagus sp. Y33]|uniref:M14 family metallopeptidase n=1 Tax=Algoriphagus sp. Y33 TaxID=2772483 RepID=UPI00177C7E56|nr:M14 family metallopeptidase [Algoriphagus sp. Y33]
MRSTLKNMRMRRIKLIVLLCSALITESFSQTERFKGQGPVESVSTAARPVEKQWKGTFEFEETSVKVSNDFNGGRLNGMFAQNDSLLIGLIGPENVPVNMSPWYAFKVWAPQKQRIHIRVTYSGSARHRYFPKISRDTDTWVPLDSTRVVYGDLEGEKSNGTSRPAVMTMSLEVGPDTLWIAGQELIDSEKVFNWMDSMASNQAITLQSFGKSREGRPMKVLTIGNPEAKHHLMVISRQHPPEVTGYLAMQAFLKTIAGSSPLAVEFREKFSLFAVPLMNPDGVDNGHWRHNSGGVDLNRDWQNFNHPETQQVRDFMHQVIGETGGEFNFGIDFHSTWDDIYYTIDPKLSGNMPGLVYEWLDAVKGRLPGYDPNISSNDQMVPTTVSRNYFFMEFDAEALVYEIGDNTDRNFVAEKGRVGAEELMRLMLLKY